MTSQRESRAVTSLIKRSTVLSLGAEETALLSRIFAFALDWIQFPAPTQCLITICNSSRRGQCPIHRIQGLEYPNQKDKAKLRDPSGVRATKRSQHPVPSTFQRHLLHDKGLHSWNNCPHLSGLSKVTQRCISVSFLVLTALVVIQETIPAWRKHTE